MTGAGKAAASATVTPEEAEAALDMLRRHIRHRWYGCQTERKFIMKHYVQPVEKRPWSEKEVRDLADLAASGVRAREISIRFGRPTSAIYLKAKRLGISLPRLPDTWSTEDMQRLIELRLDGLTFNEIGKELGRSTKSCMARFVRLIDALQANHLAESWWVVLPATCGRSARLQPDLEVRVDKMSTLLKDLLRNPRSWD